MPQRSSDLFGSTSSDTAVVSEAVGSALAMTMAAHDSSYLGAYYLGRGDGEEEVSVLDNLDPLDGLPAEPDFAEYPVIVRVEGTLRSDEVRRRFEEIGLRLLEHDEW